MARKATRRASEDEELEIVFWWMGGDSEHPIENELDSYLAHRPTRRRRHVRREPA